MNGAHIITSIWYFKVKQFTDVKLRKFRARLYARGDRKVEGVDHFEKIGPCCILEYSQTHDNIEYQPSMGYQKSGFLQ